MLKKVAVVKTNYGRFECVFEPEKDMGGYTAEAQSVRGAVSWGKNLAEAKRMLAEAIEGAIEADVISRAEKRGIVQIRERQATLLT